MGSRATWRTATIEAARLAFFRSFFRLLLGFVALAEWACVAWVLAALGRRPPAALHVLAPFGIYLLNRSILLRRAVPRPLSHFVRAYAAVAFTCIFGALFLGLAGLVWGVGAGVSLLVAGVLPASDTYLSLVNFGLATLAGLFLYGYTGGRRQLTVSRLRVELPGLPSAFDRLRIVHLSDLHIGQHLDLGELARHVERVNALDPDLICVTGDLVDRPETCAAAFPTLAGLRARHGVLVTLGNHDFYAGAETVTSALRRLTPFTVLRNAAVRVEIDGVALVILGIDDLGRDWARGVLEHPALPPLAASVPADVPFLVLSHRPDCFPQAARLGARLMLSGHTHGGQLALPPWNLAQFITRYARGLYCDGGATLYVNRGLGFTGQPVRLFTPREIACLELAAPDERGR